VDLDAGIWRAAQLRREVVGVDRPKLHHRVTRPPLDPTRTYHDAGPVQIEAGCVEEEDLPDLGFQRAEAACRYRSTMIVRGEGELELDTVGLLRQLEHPREILVG